jgi:hypothetical protein
MSVGASGRSDHAANAGMHAYNAPSQIVAQAERMKGA